MMYPTNTFSAYTPATRASDIHIRGTSHIQNEGAQELLDIYSSRIAMEDKLRVFGIPEEVGEEKYFAAVAGVVENPEDSAYKPISKEAYESFATRGQNALGKPTVSRYDKGAYVVEYSYDRSYICENGAWNRGEYVNADKLLKARKSLIKAGPTSRDTIDSYIEKGNVHKINYWDYSRLYRFFIAGYASCKFFFMKNIGAPSFGDLDTADASLSGIELGFNKFVTSRYSAVGMIKRFPKRLYDENKDSINGKIGLKLEEKSKFFYDDDVRPIYEKHAKEKSIELNKLLSKRNTFSLSYKDQIYVVRASRNKDTLFIKPLFGNEKVYSLSQEDALFPKFFTPSRVRCLFKELRVRFPYSSCTFTWQAELTRAFELIAHEECNNPKPPQFLFVGKVARVKKAKKGR